MAVHLYLGACDPAGGVLHAVLRPDGTLERREWLAADRPMYLACENNTLYVLLREPYPGESGVFSVSLNPDGSFGARGPCLPTHGRVSCFLSVQAGRIYTANYLSGSVTRMPDTVRVHVGRGVNPARQEAPHPHQILPTPDGAYLAAVDLGLDRICVYTKELEPVSETVLPPGSGPRHLAFAPSGLLAYCANELSSDISVLEYRKGVFRYLARYDALPEAFAAPNKAGAIRTAGRQVYLAQRGYDRIVAFSCDGARLQKTGDIPAGGANPWDFAVAGAFLVCANTDSGDVAVVCRSGPRCGELVDRIPLPHALCVLAVQG